VDHHEPNGVVDDAEHGEFAADPIGGLATQDVHAHRGLEVTQVRLDLPPPAAECRPRRFGIPVRIEQRGDDCDLALPIAASIESVPQFTNAKQVGQQIPRLSCKPGWRRCRLDSVDDLIVLAEAVDPDRLRPLPVFVHCVPAMRPEVDTPGGGRSLSATPGTSPQAAASSRSVPRLRRFSANLRLCD